MQFGIKGKFTASPGKHFTGKGINYIAFFRQHYPLFSGSDRMERNKTGIGKKHIVGRGIYVYACPLRQTA